MCEGLRGGGGGGRLLFNADVHLRGFIDADSLSMFFSPLYVFDAL